MSNAKVHFHSIAESLIRRSHSLIYSYSYWQANREGGREDKQWVYWMQWLKCNKPLPPPSPPLQLLKCTGTPLQLIASRIRHVVQLTSWEVEKCRTFCPADKFNYCPGWWGSGIWALDSLGPLLFVSSLIWPRHMKREVRRSLPGCPVVLSNGRSHFIWCVNQHNQKLQPWKSIKNPLTHWPGPRIPHREKCFQMSCTFLEIL